MIYAELIAIPFFTHVNFHNTPKHMIFSLSQESIHLGFELHTPMESPVVIKACESQISL